MKKRRMSTKCAQRKARRADRPTHWGFPYWCEHGRNVSSRWLIARGKYDKDFTLVVDPALPIGKRVRVISKFTGKCWKEY